MAFLCDLTGNFQVWTVPTTGGWPGQLTLSDERVGEVRYSPAGATLAFLMDVGGDEHHQIYVMKEGDDAPRNLTMSPGTIHMGLVWGPRGQYIAYASNDAQVAHFHIHVLDTHSGERRPLLRADGMNFPLAWAPDRRRILAATAESNLSNHLFLLDVAEPGRVEALAPFEGRARHESPHWSAADGKIYLLTDRDSEFLYVAVLDPASGELAALRHEDWDIEGLTLCPDGRHLATTTNVDGYSHLRVEDLRSGIVLDLPQLPRGVVSGMDFSGDGRYLVFSLTSPTLPPDIWILDLETRNVGPLTFSSTAGIPRDTFRAPETVRFPSFDGLEIPAYHFRAAGDPPPEGRPVLLHIHGGPEAQARPGFSPVIQYILSRGFDVLVPNVRGSSGYGRRYLALDDIEKRPDSVADMAAAARYLTEQGGADPRRLALMGGSYGGFMVLAGLTSQPEIWAAGVDIVGIANFHTFLQRTGAWRRLLRTCEYGDPDRDAEFLTRLSPLTHADRIRAPLLVIHGANDSRVPILEAEQIVGSLRLRGVPTPYLRFEDEGHGIVKLRNRLVAYAHVAQFIEKHLPH